MANLVAVDNKNHLKTKIDISKRELHGQTLHSIPVVLSEFTHVALQYPIVLTKNVNTGQFIFIAMFGFEFGENLFFQEKQWQGFYLPLQLQRQPFFVGDPTENSDIETYNNDYTICIDNDSPTIVVENSLATRNDIIFENTQRLFDDNGLDSPYFTETKACLAELLRGEADNKILLEHLQNMDLLTSMSLDITFENNTSTRLNGLYTIDQKKLTKLSNEHVLTLHELGVLPSIYTLINSLEQINALIELKNQQLRTS